jgi:hypothetical protein
VRCALSAWPHRAQAAEVAKAGLKEDSGEEEEEARSDDQQPQDQQQAGEARKPRKERQSPLALPLDKAVQIRQEFKMHMREVGAAAAAAGCCWMLLDAAGCCWMLLDAAGCCWMLLDAAGCCWMLLDAGYLALQRLAHAAGSRSRA